MRRRLVLGLVLLICASACGKGNPGNPSGGGGGGGINLSNGSMQAQFDGSTWNAAVIGAVYSPGGGGSAAILSISGSDAASRTIGFALIPTGAGTGTYTVAGSLGMNFLLILGAQGFTSLAGLTGSSGTVNLTTLNSTRATGTFSFVAVATSGTGAVGSKTVSNGSFNVTF